MAEIRQSAGSGLAAIEAVFRWAASDTVCDDRGCLLLNTVAELSSCDPSIAAAGKASRESMEAFFFACLEDASRRGEVAPSIDLKASARFLMNSIFGLRMVAKMRPEAQVVEDIVGAVLGALRLPAPQ